MDIKLKNLLDVTLKVTAELGGARMAIQDLLQLNRGSIVELDRAAGELIDIKLNDKVIARGKAVVVNGKLGVRLVEVVGQEESKTEPEVDELPKTG